MSEWVDFYRARMNDGYKQHIKAKYSFLINAITTISNKKSPIVEMGCGIGSISYHTQHLGVSHILTDNDEGMLDLSQVNVKNGLFYQHNLLNDTYDLLKVFKPQIIHGHGVIEHFQNDEIEHIIKNQMDNSKWVFHYVPSNKYKSPSFGDERLMSMKEWKQIAKPSFAMEYNDGYDLLLGWKS